MRENLIDITFLGTSGASPTKERSLPSIALSYDGNLFLLDCGEGTQFQLLKYGISPQRLKAIFITHIHGDHTIGIAGLVRTLALNKRREELKIFVPKGFENQIKNLLNFDKPLLGYEIRVIGITSGPVYSGKNFQISAFRLNHNVPTYGYSFKENDKINFIPGKAKKLGIKGTMFSELTRKGHLNVNGRRISLSSITTLTPGKKVVYATDTRPTAEVIKNASGADLLIHESSFGEEHKLLALQRKHATAIEAATLAKKAKAKRLVLTHFSARYRDTKQLVKEARSVFMNTTAATDGYKLHI